MFSFVIAAMKCDTCQDPCDVDYTEATIWNAHVVCWNILSFTAGWKFWSVTLTSPASTPQKGPHHEQKDDVGEGPEVPPGLIGSA